MWRRWKSDEKEMKITCERDENETCQAKMMKEMIQLTKHWNDFK